ncbi:NADPH:quinone reductase [Actinoplanes lobatus]|uniref:NADPH:quinone reductase n=1 Tax=Actinoplanes lobatus TaxID=113568 RepID=A0A7W7HK80_9ACTN|nr:NADP-dependent oxidoreductase [Actinoplanes lobatus]MBB4752082.1 NADPH:quinone reductase-like Zn-dependent oxidoreductase [Actinoplanes lobatus]GGN98850.1 NADPH:quinone reductase [Actinoplanes lobatus]GIE46223.1 NADPH:quinone reductase [Actinoplanes lobatus]
MQAIRVHEQGGPDVLRLDEVTPPEPGPGDVLVRVHAAGINPPDWYARSGFSTIPPDLRPPIRLPFTPGSDLSGVVTAIGAGVTRWRPGDEVLGMVRFGQIGNGGGGRTYAEFTTSPADDLVRKPSHVDHATAAGLPMAGLTAYQFLVDRIGLKPGATILVNGAAGGVGHLAVQLAQHLGARVIAVASGRHQQFLRDLGADQVVDYTTTDVTTAARDVDHVLDCVGGPNGHRFLAVVRNGGTINPVFFGEYHRDRAADLGITVDGGQVHTDHDQLETLAGLLADGHLRVALDGVYPLADAAAAHTRAERGHLQGKLVLTTTTRVPPAID